MLKEDERVLLRFGGGAEDICILEVRKTDQVTSGGSCQGQGTFTRTGGAVNDDQ